MSPRNNLEPGTCIPRKQSYRYYMLEWYIIERSNTNGPVLDLSEADHQGLRFQDSGVWSIFAMWYNFNLE